MELEVEIEDQEVPQEYHHLRDAFFVFAITAGKYGIDTPKKMNKALGIKTGKYLYTGDLLAHSWDDYIKFTAKIIFCQYKRGK